jgi:hypothetical protein
MSARSAITYAEIGQWERLLARAGLHEAGSAANAVWTLVSLTHEPCRRSRKRSVPPSPRIASQYILPDKSGLGESDTLFHAPVFGVGIEPALSRRRGWPFALL